jgi:hypothetical protein
MKKMFGYEIEKIVKCVRCKRKMLLPVENIGSEGGKCHSCGKYMCHECLREAHSGHFRCCSRLATKGAALVKYLDYQGLKEMHKQGLIKR